MTNQTELLPLIPKSMLFPVHRSNSDDGHLRICSLTSTSCLPGCTVEAVVNICVLCSYRSFCFSRSRSSSHEILDFDPGIGSSVLATTANTVLGIPGVPKEYWMNSVAIRMTVHTAQHFTTCGMFHVFNLPRFLQ